MERRARGATSGWLLIALGAATPILVIGLGLGGLLLARSTSPHEDVTLASEQRVDCDSPRNAWRSACQPQPMESKQSLAEELSATTGSLGTSAKRRSSSVKSAASEPEAAAPAPADKQAAVPQPAAKAWSDPHEMTEVVPQPPMRPSGLTPPEEDGAAKPARSAGLRPATEAPPPERAEPAAKIRPAAVPAAPSVAEAASEQPKPPLLSPQDRAPRLARHRTKAKEARAARREAATRTARIERRARLARPRIYREPEVTGGLRVTSVQTYILPDGRRVTVHTRPRPEVVRELMAEHRAAFATPRPAYYPPLRGGPAVSWYSPW